MDILIVDDEPLARQRLQRMAEKIEWIDNVHQAENAEQAMACILRDDPDLLLLDIHMPGTDGLTLAQQINEMDDPPAVVFCTAYDSHALDAFGAGALGYLLKPVKAEQLQQVLEKSQKLNRVQKAAIQDKINQQRQHISAKTHKGIELIALEDVRCFVADQKYVTVFHKQGEHLLDETLKELQDEFSNKLLRIHRNALVSHAHIDALERDHQGQFYLRLADIQYQPLVSRRHVSDVKEFLQKL